MVRGNTALLVTKDTLRAEPAKGVRDDNVRDICFLGRTDTKDDKKISPLASFMVA